MFEILKVAGPVLLLAVVLTIFVLLWMVNSLNRQQRLLLERLDTLERELEQLHEGLVVLTGRGARPPQAS